MPRAVECYRQSLLLRPDSDDRSSQAGTLTRLGDTHEAGGSEAAASDA
jgi:hypothetical protein